MGGRAAIYARFSSHNQRSESIEIQVEKSRAYCVENDLRVVATYCDFAQTGTNTDRAEFQRMMADAKRGLFDFVVIYKVTRIMRNRDEMAMARIMLRRCRVEILYAGEDISDGSAGVLQLGMLEVLAEYKKGIFSDLMFPSRIKPDQPIDPGYVRKRLQIILKRAGCKPVRFHDLRHTFATMSLENGMDVKTLSAIIGHISSATTIDIDSHITGAMQRQAAQKIERGIGHSEAYEPHETLDDQLPTEGGKPPVSPPFAPYKGKVRKPGTGGIYELNDHLFEGRYSPTNAQGKREVHTVYAKTKEECEVLLEQMIAEVREQIKEEKRQMKLLTTAGR